MVSTLCILPPAQATPESEPVRFVARITTHAKIT
jgi:hypothetical protein